MSADHTWALDTARAFDAVAGEYDSTNTANPILRDMRRRTLKTLRTHVAVGADLLDIGCGPGTDHLSLVESGYRVTAIDASPEMVRQAQHRASRAPGSVPLSIACVSAERLDRFASSSFDAAFSNFGPLNCVVDLPAAATEIHRVLRPGGLLVASVIGRVCPWEIALYLGRGEIRRAFVRFRRSFVAVPLKSGTVWTRYYTPGEFISPFTRAGFERVECGALGVVAPPPYLEGFASRHPSLVSRLLACDKAVASWPVVRSCGDHFVTVLRRG